MITEKNYAKYLSGQIGVQELTAKKEVNEALGMTISHPLLSGKALEVFTAEMKRWKEAGFLTKWQKDRFFTKIKLYFKGIENPYVINITALAGKDEEEGNTAKAKFKSRLIGKVKSPFRFFQTFNNWGFYDIIEKLFDMIEDDVDKGKPQKKQKLEDEEAQKWEEEFNKTMAEARRKVMVFKQIDNGNFAVTMSEESMDDESDYIDPKKKKKKCKKKTNKDKKMNIKENIMRNSGMVNLNEMALYEMAAKDLPQNYKDADDFLKQYIATYEKRMGKDFSRAAVAGLKKTLAGTDIGDDAEKVMAKAEAMFPKSAKSKGGSVTFTPEQLKAGEAFIAAVGAENAVKVLNAVKKQNK